MNKIFLLFLLFFALSEMGIAQVDSLEIRRLDSLMTDESVDDTIVIEEEMLPNEVIVENIITAYTEALGGEKKLKKFKNVVIKETLTVGDVIYNIVKYYEYPNKMTKILSLMGSRIEKTVFDGNKARSWGVKGYRIIEDEELEELKYEATIFLPLFFDKYKFELNFDTTEYVDGLEAHRITALAPNASKYEFYFDVVSGLLLRWKIMNLDEMEDPQEIIIDYDEFEEFEGFAFPQEIIYSKNNFQLNYRVTLVTVNGKLDKDLFLLKE